jgi:hypothetical protein
LGISALQQSVVGGRAGGVVRAGIVTVARGSSPNGANVAIKTGWQQVQQRRRRVTNQARAWRDEGEKEAPTIPNHAHHYAIAKPCNDLWWYGVTN